ncbi:MAG TPA: acetate--CoA ligase family protein [Mycobacteriales bacterium]
MLTDGLAAVFTPRRVALVGATDSRGKLGELLWRNLSTFPGEVVPVTSSAREVGGRTAYPSLTAVPGDLDLAVVVVPAAAVPGVIRDAAAKGVRAAVVLSGGFAETGAEGARLEREMVSAARAGGVRIVGPNCFGVQNCAVPLNASLAAGTPRAGGISLVTQSGAYGMALYSVGEEERVGWAGVCATGNKADVADAELLRHLGDDPGTRTLCFFLESLPDGRAFADAARGVTPRKPVVVAKTGRSPDGVRAARSHTASLAGAERVWRAALESAGVVLARSGLEMIDAARALDSRPAPAGRRVGIVTNSGGTGVELADLLADEGLRVPELPGPLQEALRPLLPPLASPRNPVDLTTVWSRYEELYPLVADRLARSGEVDAVVAVLVQRAADPAVARRLAEAVARLREDAVPVPVYVCWVAPREQRSGAELLGEAGVPCFDWPERTARAVGHAARYGRARGRIRPPVPGPPRPEGLPPLAAGLLDPVDAARVLAAAGIPTVPGLVCATPAEAGSAAPELGYPVVAKVVHPDVVHKSDVGGVRTGLRDARAVRAAAADLLALADGARVLVQRQLAGVEIVVGGLRDPQFGPMVLAGLGGIFTETLDDVALAPAPLDREEARDLLHRLRGRAVLAGARGTEAVDTGALAATITAVGDLLVAVPEIEELDLNPVLATPAGCVAVDWRIRAGKPPAQDERGAGDSPRGTGETDR